MKKLPFLLTAALLLSGCQAAPSPSPAAVSPSGGELTVHFIDVGQADSILVQSGEHAMLIDAGNNADGDLVVEYLQSQGVKQLDYLIGTHPHEDHIGGLDNVILSFPIETVILPQAETNTRTFEDVLDALLEQDLSITLPQVGDQYTLGDASFTILAPNGEEYSSLNNWSVVVRLENGENSFLFTGDAEQLSEEEMLATGLPLRSDVLKMGHHGSSTSSSRAFLEEVQPTYGVISCETGNDYGHPHRETLAIAAEMDIQLFRTDTQGTIVAHSDGKEITFDQQPVEAAQAPAGDITVVVTKSGKKYHLPECSQIQQSKLTPMTRSEAMAKGYEPCKNCKPEQS